MALDDRRRHERVPLRLGMTPNFVDHEPASVRVTEFPLGIKLSTEARRRTGDG